MLPLHSTQVASETWTIARMRAFLESRGTKGRPHAVVGGPGPESGEDPWEFARGEYRTAREGVERDDMRASDKAGRAWNVTWDQERFVVPFLRSEMASRAVDARRTLLFANCVALDRWLREFGGAATAGAPPPPATGPRDWLSPNGGWGETLPEKALEVLGAFAPPTERVERLDELCGTWMGFRRSYLPGRKPVAFRPYDFRTYKHFASTWRRDALLERSSALVVEHVKAPYDGLLPPIGARPEAWEKKRDERWTTFGAFAASYMPDPQDAPGFGVMDDEAAAAFARRCSPRPMVCQCLRPDVDCDDPVYAFFKALPNVPPHLEPPTHHLLHAPTARQEAHLAKCKPPILLAAHLQSDDDATEYESSDTDEDAEPTGTTRYDNYAPTEDDKDEYPGRFEFVAAPALAGEALGPPKLAAWHALVHGSVRWCLLPPNGDRRIKRCYRALDRPRPRHGDFVSGLDWFRGEYETLSAADSGVKLYEIVQEPGEVLWIPEHWSYARLYLKPSVGFAVEVGALNQPGPRGVVPALFDDPRPTKPSAFTLESDPAYKDSDYEYTHDPEFLKQLEGLDERAKKAMDDAAAKAAEKWAEAKFESGEWIRPENIAQAARDAIAQVDALLPPPPEDSIAHNEPSEMLKRWASSPFNPDQRPEYLDKPDDFD